MREQVARLQKLNKTKQQVILNKIAVPDSEIQVRPCIHTLLILDSIVFHIMILSFQKLEIGEPQP